MVAAATEAKSGKDDKAKKSYDEMSDQEIAKAFNESGAKEVGTPDIDGWWDPKYESPIFGRMLGAFTVSQTRNGQTQTREVVAVKLLRETFMVVDKKKVKAKKGQVIGLGLRAKLLDLMWYVENNGTCLVTPLEKKTLSNGNTMWMFDVKVKGERSDRRFSASNRSSSEGGAAVDQGDGDDSDIPF